MESQTIGRFALKTDQQGLEFVNPRECSLTDEAMFVCRRVEMSFPPALDRFSIAFVFHNVRFNATVPQQLPCCPRIKTTVRSEDRAFVVQSTALHISEYLFELLIELIAVVMVTCNHPSGGNNIAIAVGYGQDVAGLRLLPTLIGNFFAPFFAALWLPSRLISDKFNSPWIVRILASKRRCKLPSRLHFRK
jgi:hypothetical protein